ncbi:sodium channel subunit beta-3 [Protobothrops mucrosquamatus]|uniref:sodium channel subunit beta-3 n=1 Tax=Protobothrops mucrosquamatus TaxID=103944 RepID=UPI0010FAF01B|nr:sodium channel subunit beta-3 [Protobothrops mucrosquamatus]
MAALTKVAYASTLLAALWVGICSSVCVEVPSETEAVQGSRMKLLCISCMKREEVSANTLVKWFYKPKGGQDVAIYEYNNEKRELESPFQGRLEWNGSADMQDVSISVLNISLNDSGIYTCNVTREFLFETHRPIFTSSTLIHLTVVEDAGKDLTSVVSAIMMYILLVFLTLWLLIEMIYCYRKISKAEETAQENATNYLAIPSENKENCALPVEE